MTPQILQSLISINRNSIREYEDSVEYHKVMRDSNRLHGYTDCAEQHHKLMLANKKHLALLVRNQVELKKALRDAYDDEQFGLEYTYGEIDYV